MQRAIASIPDDVWIPVRYPGAVQDPDTGAWISDAEVAEIPYAVFRSKPGGVTARPIVRRVRDAARQDELFPVWRYRPFFTDSTEPVTDADLTHRRHAVIETVFVDLIDGPLAQLLSGRFGANSAWVLCAAIAHNLLRAAGRLADPQLGRARGATLRRKIINIPARSPDRNAGPSCTCPLTGHGPSPGGSCGRPPLHSRPLEYREMPYDQE